MDGTQMWAVACTREALEDYGYPERPLNLERTAVILGNALAGEKHYLTSLRAYFLGGRYRMPLRVDTHELGRPTSRLRRNAQARGDERENNERNSQKAASKNSEATQGV